MEEEKETGQERTIGEKPPGLEDVESEQEVREEERRAQEAREEREREASAHEERERLAREASSEEGARERSEGPRWASRRCEFSA